MLDLIQWRARKTPEAQALFFNGRWYTFREMEGRANRLANRLLGQGIKAGDRVGVIAHNHLVHFDLLLAAAKIGVVFAPFNPYLERPALVAAVQRVRPAMVFVDSRYHDLAAVLGLPWARLSEYRDWLAVGSPELPPAPALTVEHAHTIYSTSRGAAVMPYRQVLLNARVAADTWGLSARDSTVHCLPCFGPELNLLCLPLLYRGGRVVLMSNFDTDEFLGHLALHRVSVAALAPEMLRYLVSYSDFEEADLSSLHWFASVGAVAPASVRQALQRRGLSVRTLVALAEAGPNLFNATLEALEQTPTLLGKPLPEVQVLLHRPSGELAPEGEPGAADIAGSMGFSGYLDAEGQLSPAGLPATSHGLALSASADGQYRYEGSAAAAFCSGENWVFPGRLEAELLQVEGVVDCAITRLPDAVSDGGLLASVVLQDGCALDDGELAAAIAWRLPDALGPVRFHRRKSLPRNAWGEVRRELLVTQFEQSLPQLA